MTPDGGGDAEAGAELFGKMGGRFEAEDFGNFFYRLAGIEQQVAGFFEPGVEIMLTRADANTGGEMMPEIGVTHTEFAGKCLEIERFLATQGNEAMGTLDDIVDGFGETAFAPAQMAEESEEMECESGQQILVGESIDAGEAVAAFETIVEVRGGAGFQNPLRRFDEAVADGGIEDIAVAFDPMLDPTGFRGRLITVPDAREENHDAAGFHGLDAGEGGAFKHAGAGGNQDDLVMVENAAFAPVQIMVEWMLGPRIRSVRRNVGMADGSGDASPNGIRRLLGQVGKIIFHCRNGFNDCDAICD